MVFKSLKPSLLFCSYHRPLRAASAGLVYHVLNRANGRLTLFAKDGDLPPMTMVRIGGVGSRESRNRAASSQVDIVTEAAHQADPWL